MRIGAGALICQYTMTSPAYLLRKLIGVMHVLVYADNLWGYECVMLVFFHQTAIRLSAVTEYPHTSPFIIGSSPGNVASANALEIAEVLFAAYTAALSSM